jgi:hypothetical protein
LHVHLPEPYAQRPVLHSMNFIGFHNYLIRNMK